MTHDYANLSLLIAHLDIKIHDHQLVALLGEDAYRVAADGMVIPFRS